MTENNFKRAVEIKKELKKLESRFDEINKCLNSDVLTNLSVRYRKSNGYSGEFTFERLGDFRTRNLLELEANVPRDLITKLEHEFKIL